MNLNDQLLERIQTLSGSEKQALLTLLTQTSPSSPAPFKRYVHFNCSRCSTPQLIPVDSTPPAAEAEPRT